MSQNVVQKIDEKKRKFRILTKRTALLTITNCFLTSGNCAQTLMTRFPQRRKINDGPNGCNSCQSRWQGPAWNQRFRQTA